MIIDRIKSSIELKNQITKDENLISKIDDTANLLIKTFRDGYKVLFCGNGGSAADAQHLAAELSGRFYFDRPPLPAEACHVNPSFLTAVSNDYGYNRAFARYVEATSEKGDVLIGLSTSGNSENIIQAFDVAKNMGITCVGFTGIAGGKMKDISDILINVPSDDTPRIQEAHITIGHIICEIVEATLFKNV